MGARTIPNDRAELMAWRDVHECRLSADDYRRIDERLSERIGDLCRRDRTYAPRPWEWVRLAWHAIGCDEHDLRACELDTIAVQVEAVCAFYWSDRGREVAP